MLTDRGVWKAHFRTDYYDGDVSADDIAAGRASLVETHEADGNILVNGGITALLTLLIGGGGTAFNNANSYIGVGDSTTAAAAAQTDLQAATNKFRKAMDATFPSVSGQTVTFRATFATGEANYSIQEAGVFNASTAGTMLNRKVSDLGVKTSASTMQLTVTVTIS